MQHITQFQSATIDKFYVQFNPKSSDADALLQWYSGGKRRRSDE